MSQLLVRNIDPVVKERLRERARRHGRSMEAEARSIIEEVVRPPPSTGSKLSEQLAALFKDIGLKPGEELARMPPSHLKSPFDDDHR